MEQDDEEFPFNTLLEMRPCGSAPPPRPDPHFQYSIRDASLYQFYKLYRHCLNAFNTLLEMHTPVGSVGIGVDVTFNTLLEMHQIPERLVLEYRHTSIFQYSIRDAPQPKPRGKAPDYDGLSILY